MKNSNEIFTCGLPRYHNTCTMVLLLYYSPKTAKTMACYSGGHGYNKVAQNCAYMMRVAPYSPSGGSVQSSVKITGARREDINQ